MRDIGIFSAKEVPSDELTTFLRSYAMSLRQSFEKRDSESVVGQAPNILHVSDDTSPTNGYFSDDERQIVTSKLGAEPHAYISIHFSSGDETFALADGAAREMSRIWEGIIDYSGSGGELGEPPTAVA